MKSKKLNYLTAVAGLILAGIGLYLVKTQTSPAGLMLTLPYICVGIGCGFFGHGMGNIMSHNIMKNYKDEYKQMEIEKNDERNIAILNASKAKAYDIMVFVLGALMISLALMNVDLIVVLLLVFAYLFIQGSAIYYRSKFDKIM